jgi:hypothetical protein
VEDLPDIHAVIGGEGGSKIAGMVGSELGKKVGSEVGKELGIRTHYESLDIAQSRRIHYICFTLTEKPLPDRDNLLMERIKNEEPIPPARPLRPPRIKGKTTPTA